MLRSRASIARLRCSSAQTRSRSWASCWHRLGWSRWMAAVPMSCRGPGLLAGAENIRDMCRADRRHSAPPAHGSDAPCSLSVFGPAHQRRTDRRPFRRRDQAVIEEFAPRPAPPSRPAATPSACESCSIACGTPPAASTQRISLSRWRITSRTRSRNVTSAAASTAWASASAERAVGLARGLQHHVEAELFEQLVLLGLVEHLEPRGDIGLERKQMQKLSAEGVDGVDLQPARRLQRQREKLPRAQPPRRVDLFLAGAGAWRRRGRRRPAPSSRAGR